MEKDSSAYADINQKLPAKGARKPNLDEQERSDSFTWRFKRRSDGVKTRVRRKLKDVLAPDRR